MKVLLVEDDGFKEELLAEAIHALVVDAEIAIARSVQQAVGLLGQQIYDLILLDMSLPSHEIRAGGAQPVSQPSGGVEILLELSYEERSDGVVIVTQYPEIEFNGAFYSLSKFPRAVIKELDVNLKSAIYFNATEIEWRTQLKAAIA